MSKDIIRKHFTPEQSLDILRAGDRLRKWHSLDDKRVCVMCDQVFTGRQIEISRDQRGRYLLKCPTNGCPSFVAHWTQAIDDESLRRRKIGNVAQR